MARDVPCTAADCGAASVVIITNLQTGEVDSLCPEHFPQFIYAAADALGMIPPTADQVEAKGGTAAEDTRRPKSRRRGPSPQPSDAEAAPTSSPETAPAAPDIAEEPE